MMNVQSFYFRVIKQLMISLFCFAPILVFGQAGGWQSIYQSNTNASLIPPSPTAASFQKYGLTPVSFNTGVPNISLPLYEVKAGDLSMPITLSYHSNGFKPREEAGWVGLGWNLNVGGCITRMKKGAVDDTRPGGNNFGEFDAYSKAMDETNPDPLNQAYPFQKFLFATYTQQTYDTEPDIYVFNFMGHQGKFIYVNGWPYFVEFERWIVQKSGSDGSFVIIDENGTQYNFTIVEYTRSKSPSKEDPLDPPQGWASCWQLTSVTSADKKHWINFYYTPYTFGELNTVASQTYSANYGEKAPNGNSACTITIPPPFSLTTNTPIGNNITGWSLSSIVTSEQQTISFIQSTAGRQDLQSTQNALQQMVVYGQAGNPNTVIKKTSFQYGYFGNTDFTTYARLKLSGVYELNAADDTLNFHTFEYSNEFDPFPSKSSVGIDQWGYANDGDVPVSAASLVQDVPIQTSQYGTKQTIISPVPQPPAPKAQYAMVGMLSKVHYPTGGYSSYSYEQNKYSYYNSVSLPTEVTQMIPVHQQVFFENADPNALDSAQGSFFMNIPGQVTINVSRTVWDSLLQSGNPVKNLHPTLRLWRNDTLIYTSLKLFDEDTWSDVLTLPAGDYDYTVYCEGKDQQETGGIIYPFLHHILYDDDNSPAAPGLRIASISDYTDVANTVPAITRSYKYLDSTGRCTGSLQEMPHYEIYTTYEGACPVVIYNQSSDNNGLYNAALQFQFNYGGVREYVAPSRSNTYYTEHYFDPILVLSKYIEQTAFIGLSYQGASLPPGGFTTENLNLTEPLEVLTVDWVNTKQGYQKIKQVASTFKVVEDSIITGLRPISLTGANINSTSIGNTVWSVDAWRWHPLWRYPVSKLETDYDTTGNQYNILTKYTYDLDKRELMQTEETVNNGKTILTKYKYPDNYELGGGVGALEDAHLLTPAVETQIWQKTGSDSTIIKGVVDDFDQTVLKPSIKYFLFTDHPLAGPDNEQVITEPTVYLNLISDSRYREKIRFKYDARGNIIETNLDSNRNIPTAYVWGYHHLYPVAKIFGARFADVLTKIDTAALQSITSDVAMRSALDILRSLPGTQVTTYTYTPFVGVTSETDFNGRTTYYEYDAFNRVMNIKDFQFNLLKNFFYNYATHPTTPLIPPPAQVPVTMANPAQASGFSVVYTNISTAQQYTFVLPTAGGALGNVPAGTYNVVLTKSGNTTSYQFGLNCGGLLITGVSASFSNITVGGNNCDEIILNNAN